MKNALALLSLFVFCLAGGISAQTPASTPPAREPRPGKPIVQSDAAFHTYMAQWMDKQTEGALGGSALHYLRVTVDWPNAIAVFEKA